MKLSLLLISVIVILAAILGLITGFSIDYIVGISISIGFMLVTVGFLFLIRYLLRHKDYIWSANIAQFLTKRLEILRFLLQVLFMNPYAHRRLKNRDTNDYQKMK